MRQLRARLWILGLLSASIGCTDTTDSTVLTEDVAIPTSVTVPPEAFLGSVPCSNEKGALHSYVATLTDLGVDPTVEAPFILPSSPPVPCSDSVVFRYIVVGHYYKAKIDGYDLYASELTPAPGGNPSSGSSTMLRKTDDKAVLPRWTTACKEGAVANLNDEVLLTAQDCDPLAPTNTGSSSTSIRVDPSATLGLLTCKNSEGENKFDSFTVTPQDSALPKLTGLLCSSKTQACPENAVCVAEYLEKIEAGKTYTFAVHALTADGTTLSASCLAKAQAGLIVTAICDPLPPPPPPP
jgi:hypothetical protein